MKIIKEVGLHKLTKYIFYKFIILIYKFCYLSPLQICFLRILGAKIGNNVVFENVKFYNLYTKGFKNLEIGNNVYIGEETLIDMANKVVINNNVTIAARVNIVTHLNVGYSDNFLRRSFPRQDGNVIIKDNVFIGTNTVVLHNVVIEKNNFIGAYSMLTSSTEKNCVYYGIPAKKIREID